MTYKSMKLSWDKLCKAVADMDNAAREQAEQDKTKELQHEITSGDLARDYQFFEQMSADNSGSRRSSSQNQARRSSQNRRDSSHNRISRDDPDNRMSSENNQSMDDILSN